MNSKVRHMGEVARCVRIRMEYYCKLHCKQLWCAATLCRHRDINRAVDGNICPLSICLSLFPPSLPVYD